MGYFCKESWNLGWTIEKKSGFFWVFFFFFFMDAAELVSTLYLPRHTFLWLFYPDESMVSLGKYIPTWHGERERGRRKGTIECSLKRESKEHGDDVGRRRALQQQVYLLGCVSLLFIFLFFLCGRALRPHWHDVVFILSRGNNINKQPKGQKERIWTCYADSRAFTMWH